MNRIIKTTFENRGYDSDYMQRIENFKNETLRSTDDLIQSLYNIYLRGDLIVVLPDFDMDGIMSGVIGFAGLAELGFNCSLYIPTPSEGYGFTPSDIDLIMEQYPDVKAVITCDVGISCNKAVAYAKAMGLTVFVTDHHMPEKNSKLAADCIVNPMRSDDPYNFKEICGANVLYKCLYNYALKYCDVAMQERIERLRVFAGIGTISDMMLLADENRQLVRDCVSFCRLLYSNGDNWFVNVLTGSEIYKRAFRGLFTALKVFGELGKISSNGDINESFFGYYFAPAFNSIKRLDGDMSVAFGVFFGNDSEGNMNDLIVMNDRRKILVKQYFDEIMSSSQSYAPYVYMSNAPGGILGLLATEFIKKTGVPTFVVHEEDGVFKGSGRSPEWYPALSLCGSKGFGLAGHEGAFGVMLSSEDDVKRLVKHLDDTVSECLHAASLVEHKDDFVIALDGTGDSDIDIPLFAEYLFELDRYRPFGKGFEEPEIVFKFKRTDGMWSNMGRLKQHLKISFKHGFDVVCWNQGQLINSCFSECVVRGHLSLNEFRDTHTVNLVGSLSEGGD